MTLRTEEYYLSMGPQHPSTHGVLRLILKMDGETIVEATPDIGYIHRGLEKIAENRVYIQFIPLTDRLDYLSAMSCNWGYVLTVEKLAGLVPPARTEYLRVIMGEFNRLASHLIWLGTLSLDLGAITPFLYCFREREMIIDLFEMVCGQRLTYNYMRFAGVSHDITPQFAAEAAVFLKYFNARIDEYEDLLTNNPIFLKRTKGVGVITPAQAIGYGLSGPILRSSGVKRDLRKDFPYSVYPQFSFETPTRETGDCWDRYIVRIREMRESIKILGQALAGVPEGPFKNKVPLNMKVPVGEAYAAVESPRGEIGYYIVSTGSNKPYRLKIRTPSFCNLSIISEIVKGCKLADAVAILGTFDIVLGEIDR